MLLAAAVKERFPQITIYCWTGYLLENLDENKLKNIDVLIDGPYIQEERDITLYLRGSRNQRVLYNGIDFNKKN
jgi:anaerobic ribonucleoside-triphosphate reductase activating protein